MKGEKNLCQTNLWVGGVMTNEKKQKNKFIKKGAFSLWSNKQYLQIQINVPG